MSARCIASTLLFIACALAAIGVYIAIPFVAYSRG